MECKECKKELKQITISHLKKCCGLTVLQYKEKYGDKSITDTEHLKKYYQGENNRNWKGGSKKECQDCGCSIDKRSERCVSCSSKLKAGEGNGFFGKTHTNDTRNKMSGSQKERDPKTRFVLPTTDSKIISENQKKYWASLSYEDKIKRLGSFIEAGRKSCTKFRRTSIEVKVEDWLIENGVSDFKQNITVRGFNVDFKIGNKIIECYGDYWHCNPKVFNPKQINKSLKITAEEKWLKDQERINILKSKGFEVIVFWGDEIRNDFDSVTNKLKEFLWEI